MKFPCLYPGCDDKAIPSTLRCVDHVGHSTLEYAEEYAFTVLGRRAGAELSFMSAARFEGTCGHLLVSEAWREVSWLSREALRLRDPLARGVQFPTYLRVAAMNPRSRELLG